MVIMNDTYENEKLEKLATSIFIPPKPSCRKPIKRMMDDDPSPKKTRTRTRSRFSNSPVINRKDYSDSENSADSEVFSDDEDYENSRDSVESGSPCYEPERVRNVPFESVSRQRKTPTSSPVVQSNQQKTPKTTVNVTFNVKNYENYENTTEKTSHSYKQSTPRQNLSKTSPHSTPRSHSASKTKKGNSIITAGRCVGCFIVVGVIILSMSFGLISKVTSDIGISSTSKRLERFENLKNDFNEIKRKFPTQNSRMWREIQAGITAVINKPQKPWMFVLFSNDTEELSCLAEYLGNASSKALHSEKSLSLKPENLGDDYGEAIERWRFEIKEKKAVVVHDLLNVHPKAIQAFHAMCDKENPLVGEAVYIMTIVTPDYIPGSQTPEEFVENQLTNRFINKVPDDKLQPLITRLMDGPIIPVTPEVSLSGCPI